MDRHRQRNDCLGWSRRRLFQHRRQILRRCSGSDTHANTFSDSDRDRYANSHSNGNCNAYAYTHGNTYPDTNRDSYSNSHSNTERYCETQSDIAAAPDAGTSTLEVRK